MSATPSDQAARAAAQKARWDEVAPAWARWWPMIEAGAGQVSAQLLDSAALAPGARVLDLACGIGEPALSAAARVGPGGQVTAVDLAPTMVALARDRARQAGLGNVTFHEMDAAAPDFPAASFDVVLSRWGLMFVADFDATARRIRKLLVPGGRFALAVWSTAERVPAISLAGRVLSDVLKLPPPEPGQPTPFDLADTPAVAARLAAAGFAGFESREVNVRYDFESVEAFLAFRNDLSPPDPRLAEVPAADMAAAWRAVAAALEPHRDSRGHVVLDNLALCYASRRP